MLSVEDKKICVEKFSPDGFELSKNKNAIISNGECFYMSKLHADMCVWRKVYSPLFLQRVIEGINKHFSMDEKGFFISQDITGLEVTRWRGQDSEFFPFDCFDNIEQAKEQAIKYILERL